MRFGADDGHARAIGVEREAQVEVFVRGLARARGYRVHVDVEDAGRCEHEIVDARFFARFAASDGAYVGVAVGMAAGLQPLLEFTMMDEHGRIARTRDDPRRARDVSRKQRAFETSLMTGYEIVETIAHRALASVARRVANELVEERAAAVRARRGGQITR